MAKQTVKLKFTPFRVVSLLGLGTFLASAAGVFPETWVEKLFSRNLFPTFSHSFALVADNLPFSSLDLILPAAFAVVVAGLWRRRWAMALGVVASLYLWFFWTWGLNYHRVPLETQLSLVLSEVEDEDVDQLARQAASELNRLYVPHPETPLLPLVSETAAARVRR